MTRRAPIALLSALSAALSLACAGEAPKSAPLATKTEPAAATPAPEVAASPPAEPPGLHGVVHGKPWSYVERDGEGLLTTPSGAVKVTRGPNNCRITDDLHGCHEDAVEIAESILRYHPNHAGLDGGPPPGSCPIDAAGAVPISRFEDLVRFPICEGERCVDTWAEVREIAPAEGAPRAWILAGGARSRGEFAADCGNWGECTLGVAYPCGDNHLVLALPLDYRVSLDPDGVEGGLWALREPRRAGSADAEPEAAPTTTRWVFRDGAYVDAVRSPTQVVADEYLETQNTRSVDRLLAGYSEVLRCYDGKKVAPVDEVRSARAVQDSEGWALREGTTWRRAPEVRLLGADGALLIDRGVKVDEDNRGHVFERAVVLHHGARAWTITGEADLAGAACLEVDLGGARPNKDVARCDKAARACVKTCACEVASNGCESCKDSCTEAAVTCLGIDLAG